MKPLALDLFCGAGGVSKGLADAGFEVWGVDIKPQPRYIHPGRFVQGDALDPPFDLREFDFIWASPPCQQYTPLRARQGWKEYPDLLSATRESLMESARPWVIENVPGAPFNYYITLCGGMFGLRTYRHRRFESSFLMLQPSHPPHVTKTSTKKRRKCFDAGLHISVTGDVGSYVGPACMGIDWMNGNELSQAIPPAYAEYIGREFLRQKYAEAAE